MKPYLFALLVGGPLMLMGIAQPAAASTELNAPSIQQLAWLIGEWDFEDVQVNGDYRESGTRICEWALDDTYIQCTSHGVSHTGKQRSYMFFFNYNAMDERFECVSVVGGGFPRKILYIVDVKDGGNRMELVYGGWESDQINYETHAVIEYNGSNRYEWATHAAHDGPDTGNEEVRFRDTAIRRQ